MQKILILAVNATTGESTLCGTLQGTTRRASQTVKRLLEVDGGGATPKARKDYAYRVTEPDGTVQDFPSQKALAEYFGLSQPRVSTLLRPLTEALQSPDVFMTALAEVFYDDHKITLARDERHA